MPQACIAIDSHALVQNLTITNLTAVNTFWAKGGLVMAEGLVGAPPEVLQYPSSTEALSPIPAPGAWPASFVKPLRPDYLWITVVQQVCSSIRARANCKSLIRLV